LQNKGGEARSPGGPTSVSAGNIADGPTALNVVMSPILRAMLVRVPRPPRRTALQVTALRARRFGWIPALRRKGLFLATTFCAFALGGFWRRNETDTVNTPRNIQLIGQEVAIVWDDGEETYFPMDRLRAASPSAEQQG